MLLVFIAVASTYRGKSNKYQQHMFYEVDKYTDCNLKTKKLLNCALIGVFAVTRSNTINECVSIYVPFKIVCLATICITYH